MSQSLSQQDRNMVRAAGSRECHSLPDTTGTAPRTLSGPDDRSVFELNESF